MLFLAAHQDRPIANEPIALALLLVAIVCFAVMVLRKNHSAKKQAQQAPQTPVEVPAAPAAPGSAGQLKLHDVAPKTAAMLMAIVAEQIGKPINELRFISIKEVKES